jgi:hypothetical protein
LPTKPIEVLLDRDLARIKAQEIIEIASPLLKELINYATNVFGRSQTSTTGNENEDLPILILYLHMIEVTDGIEVLISQSCPAPAIPLVRSSFEALLYIEYILEADYVQRSLSWLAQYLRKRIETYELLDQSTPQGNEFRGALANEKHREVQNLTLPPQSDVQPAIANLQNLLKKPQFQPIESEFNRHRGKVPWYKLFNSGINNLRELAHHLKRGAEYDFLYRNWSLISHANDLSRFLGRTTDNASAFNRLRSPQEIKNVTSSAASFILAATHLVLSKFRHSENMQEWYKREIQKQFRFVSNR